MKKFCLRSLPCLLLAVLAMTMTGCGANSRALNGENGSGSVTAKLAVKGADAKAVASALPSGVASLQFLITGSDSNGKAIPVVRSTFTSTDSNGKASVSGIYPGTVTVGVKALDGTGVVMFEGFAIGVKVVAGPTPADAGTIVLSVPQFKAQDANCVACHETTLDVNGQNLVADFFQSGHYVNQGWTNNAKFGITGTGCAGCHGPGHNDPNPANSGRCFECHGDNISQPHRVMGNNLATACARCHQPHNTALLGCTDCHATPQNATDLGAYVNDNNGVRAITSEFGKWSHHVTGVAVNNAHCAACHLEGKVKDGAIVVDINYHMTDAQIHLRNVDNDLPMNWDPANPSFTTMDTFCLSCHDSNGATSAGSQAIQAVINANGIAAAGKVASATNPFGDTISNQYDKMQRPAVVDAAGQFATGNNSHHAVLGQKYTARTRIPGKGTLVSGAFTANSSATLVGARSTIFDAGRFNSTYTTLGDNNGVETGARNGGTSLGDDSTLHCGDCHTVGQYRAADVGVKPYNNAVIGAHGANNEYLLRNNAGTDAKHIGAPVTTTDGTKPYLVCYNCHNQVTYAVNSHAGEEESSANCNGYANTYGNYTASGAARLRSRQTNGSFSTSSGNIFGIQCANCHNSGLNNGFGGIHGSKIQTYINGIGNVTNHRRFMPGLSNVMFVPGTKAGVTGGTVATYTTYSGNRNGTGTGKTSSQTFSAVPVRNAMYANAGYTGVKPSYNYTTGGVTNDLNWEQKTAQSIVGYTDPTANPMGCYTLTTNGTYKINALTTAGYPANDQRLSASDSVTGVDGAIAAGDWGGCTHHNGAAGAGTSPTRAVVRPVSY